MLLTYNGWGLLLHEVLMFCQHVIIFFYAFLQETEYYILMNNGLLPRPVIYSIDLW